MKIRLIQTIYASELKSRAVLVMNYLIFRANREGTCFPAIKTIARECHIGVNTVKRALDDLVDAGYVKKEARFIEAKNGAQTSNLYTLSEGMFASDDIDAQAGTSVCAVPASCEDDNEPIERESFDRMGAAAQAGGKTDSPQNNTRSECPGYENPSIPRRPVPDGTTGSFSCAFSRWAAPRPTLIPP